MSATVAAALKKIAVAILTEPKVLKKVCGIILVVLFIILLPVFVLAGFSNGDIVIDMDRLQEMAIENMSEEKLAMMEHMQNTTDSIATEMSAAGYSRLRITEAQVLCFTMLVEESYEDGFVTKLVNCFAGDPSDSQLIANVNAAFGTTISAQEFSQMLSGVRATYIDVSDYTGSDTKNNLDLVQWAIDAERQGWGYVWGTYGKVLDRSLLDAKIEQYPDNVGIYQDFIESHWLNRRTADCIGLIKGYSWLNEETLQIEYGSNGMPDINADSMYHSNAEKGPISTIPEIPGLAVWRSGHIGVYIGNGKVIEAKATKIGVVETDLSAGTWTHWIKIPYIQYIEEPEETEPEATTTTIEGG